MAQSSGPILKPIGFIAITVGGELTGLLPNQKPSAHGTGEPNDS